MGNERPKLNASLKLAFAAIFGALAVAVTIAFVLPIPATIGGYFNLGEVIIYTAALVFGPYVGAFAGGSVAIADVLVGAGVFAPGTLVIKSLEGAIVGFLNRGLKKRGLSFGESAAVSVVIGGIEMVAGYFAYEQLVVGYSLLAALGEVPFNVVQMAVGLGIALPIMYAVQRVFPQLKS